jgi:hypothetical protein
LQNYLHQRDHQSHILKIGESSRLASLKKSVCRELDRLDIERENKSLAADQNQQRSRHLH